MCWCQFFQKHLKTIVLVNYHFLWSTPNKSVQQPQQPKINGRLKIQDNKKSKLKLEISHGHTTFFSPHQSVNASTGSLLQGQRCLDSDLEDLQMKVKRPLLLGWWWWWDFWMVCDINQRVWTGSVPRSHGAKIGCKLIGLTPQICGWCPKVWSNMWLTHISTCLLSKVLSPFVFSELIFVCYQSFCFFTFWTQLLSMFCSNKKRWLCIVIASLSKLGRTPRSGSRFT